MSAKVKTIRQGKIQTDKFVTKRHLDVSPDELAALIATCHPSPGDEGGPLRPSIGPAGELYWKDPSQLPPCLLELCRQVRGVHNLKEEVESMTVRIFPPVDAVGKTSHKIDRVPMNIASRVVLCVGTREFFQLTAGGGGMSGTGEVMCVSGESFQISMGAASVTDIVFNDTTSGQLATRDGFRPIHLRKDPTRRYVVVIDGQVSIPVLLKTITAKSEAMSRGDPAVAARLRQEMISGFGLSDVDAVAAAAGASVDPLGQPPVGTPLEG